MQNQPTAAAAVRDLSTAVATDLNSMSANELHTSVRQPEGGGPIYVRHQGHELIVEVRAR